MHAIDRLDERIGEWYLTKDAALAFLQRLEDQATCLEIDMRPRQRERFRQPTARIGQHQAEGPHTSRLLVERRQEGQALFAREGQPAPSAVDQVHVVTFLG